MLSIVSNAATSRGRDRIYGDIDTSFPAVAIRANMRGPIPSPSWNAKTKSV